MAGTIIVSSIKTDTDNSFIVRSNTGATLFSVDTTSISIPDGSITSAMIANGTVIAADVADGSITTSKIADGNVTNAKIDSVANTKITGLITSAQIASVANTKITGNIIQSQIATGVAGTGPAFSAYLSSTQTVSSSTTTKVAFNAETFDTNSNYDTSTYRFTPTVAGYYQVNAWIYGSGAGFLETYLYKNGSLFNRLSFSYTASVQANGGSCLTYLNGSTDYIEIYTFNTTATTLDSGSTYNYFQAVMVRSA